MKKIISFLTLFVIFVLISQLAIFAKMLPRFGATKKKTVVPASTSQYVSAKLRADRKALLVTFKNLQNTRSVDYTLTYTASGVEQGIAGSVDVGSGSVSRELVFGTASKGVYTYHTNIKNMKFVVTIVSKNGKTIVKKFTVKP